MKKVAALIFPVLVVFSVNALADRGDVRQDRQAERIAQGVSSGELTKKETKRLINQQRSIARTEKRFKSDGIYTRKERAIVEAKQDKASAAIYAQKHDRQDRN